MRRVYVVGMGPGPASQLTAAAREALAASDIVVGARRILESLAGTCDALLLEAALGRDMVAALQTRRDWRTATLAMTGDIGFYSGAQRALEELADTGWHVECIPGISSLQLFAARLGRAWQGWHLVSAHGKACDIVSLVHEHDELFLLTDARNTPGALCELLTRAGMGAAHVSVGERLGYADERIVCARACELADREFSYLCTMLVERGCGQESAERPEAPGAPQCAPTVDPRWPWASSGIPDEAFSRADVPMTKQEVRAVALAKLRVAAGDTVFDIGAGTGSVTVELSLLASQGRVYAVERDAGARRLIVDNVSAFGCGNVHVVAGTAPAALEGLPAPDAAFIGGSGGELPGIVEALHTANPRVRLCVACITLETLSLARELLADEGRFEGFEVCCVAVSRSSRAAGSHLLRALNPVYLLSAQGRECV